MRRRLAGLLVTVLAVAITATAAHADKPLREGLPAEDFFLEGGLYCAFDLSAEVLVNREVITSFYDEDGNLTRQIITGRLTYRLTNVETGASLDVNISGPAVFTFHPDGALTFEFFGRALLFYYENQFGDGAPGEVYIITGHTTVHYDAEGNRTFTQTGEREDMCAALS